MNRIAAAPKAATSTSPAVSMLGLDLGEQLGASPLLGRSAPAPAVERSRAEGEDEAAPANAVEIPKDKDEAPAIGPALRSFDAVPTRTGPTPVATVIRRGAAPTTHLSTGLRTDPDRSLAQGVAPGGSPATGNGSNDCLPSTAGAVIAWNVVSADVDNWRVDVQSLTLKGQVNVRPWPSNPTSATTPNTANPVDGGNITRANFQGAIDDMADYNLAGGGAGPNWHSTAASSAHEWAHWNTDYVSDSVNSAAGGNWPTANSDLDKLTQPKATSATAADAKTALQARVDTRIGTWRTATVARWNAIPDTAGVAGSTGYEAGARVLAGLISSVRTYAITKGWAAPPAAPGP